MSDFVATDIATAVKHFINNTGRAERSGRYAVAPPADKEPIEMMPLQTFHTPSLVDNLTAIANSERRTRPPSRQAINLRMTQLAHDLSDFATDLDGVAPATSSELALFSARIIWLAEQFLGR